MEKLKNDMVIRQAFSDLTRYIAANNRNKGFNWKREDFPKASVLMISEIIEAVDEDRRFGKDTKITEELADAIIRILDFAGQMDWDIGSSLLNKVEYNKQRPFMHNRKY